MKAPTRVLGLCLLTASLAAAQGSIVQPGENLIAEGIPPIPISLADTVGRYTDFRAATLQDWHPTRREMLISTRLAETVQIHRVSLSGGARYQLTFFRDPVVGARYSPGAGDYFIFVKDVGGGEWFQNYSYSFSTGAVTLLTDGGRSQNSLGVWSNAGDRIAYSSTRRNGKDRDIWLMNPLDPQCNRLLLEVEGSGWAPGGWSPDDKQLVVGEELSVNESSLWLVDVATGKKTLLTPKGRAGTVAYGSAVFSKDGKGLYVATDKDSEFRRLAYIDLGTGAHTYLLPSARTVPRSGI